MTLNAVAETFFATLKKELVYRRSWPTRQELCSEVFEYIEGFYNPRRRHSTLEMLSPVEFEEQHASRGPAPTPTRKTSEVDPAVAEVGHPRPRARGKRHQRQRRVEDPSGFQHQQRLLQRQRLGFRLKR